MSDDGTTNIDDMEELKSLGLSEEEIAQALIAAIDDTSEIEESSATSAPLDIYRSPEETFEAAFARTLLRSDIQAAQSIEAFGRGRFAGDSDFININELVAQLESQIDKVASGDLTVLDQTLFAQICTLDALFNALLRRSGRNMGTYTQSAWEYMKLALRAQSQCRSTVEALADMKKPRPEILRQTNIAHGHQQVNNLPPNELMEQHDERMDAGTPPEAVRGDQAMEPVGKEHGAEND